MKNLITYLIILLTITSVDNILAQDTLSFEPIRRTILVKGDHFYPPYEFINEQGEPDGFNVELFKALAKELNFDYKLELGPWNIVRQELENGEIDVLMGMMVSPERAQKMIFGTPHSLMTQGIFTSRESKINTLNDLAGKEVIVQNGDIMHDYLVKTKLTDKIITVADQYTALSLINSNKHDAAIIGNFQGSHLIKKHKFKNVVLRSSDIEPKRYAMAANANNKELLWMLNLGLYQLKANGTYDELYNKWFSIYEDNYYLKKYTKQVTGIGLFFIIMAIFIILLRAQVKRSIKKLRASESKLNAVTKVAPSGMGVINNERFTEVNNRFLELTGYSRKEIIGMPLEKLHVSSEEYQIVNKSLTSQIKEYGNGSCEAVLKQKNGSTIEVIISATSIDSSIPYKETVFTLTDISFQKDAQRQIYMANNRLRFQLENSPLAVIEYDNKFRVTGWSKQAENIFGWSQKELLGKCLKDMVFLHEEDMPYVVESIRQMTSGMLKSNVILNRNYTKHGQILDCEWYNSTLFDDNGELISIFSLVNNVTQLRKIERKVKEEQERLKCIIDAASIASWEWNIQTNEVRINNYYATLLGYEYDELVPFSLNSLHNLINPESITNAQKQIEKHFTNTNEKYESEIQLKHKNGSWITVIDRGSIISYSKDGKPLIMMGTITDITLIKQASQQIKKLSVATEQSPASVLITDTEGIIEYVNQKFLDTSGYPSSKLIGTKLRILKPEHTPEHEFINLINSIKNGSGWKGEHENKKMNGEKYWESVNISAICNETNNISNYVVVSEDISASKKLQNDLIIAKEKAEENDNLKTAFLKNLSHEVRTPLNAIVGFSEFLANTNAKQDKKEFYSNVIKKSSAQLLSIIENIITISMIETGQVKIYETPVSINQLLNNIYNQFITIYEKEGVTLKVNSLISKYEDNVVTDHLKIEHILNNLVDNAIKFTNKGTIQFGCKIENQKLCFSVEDSGEGFPEELKEFIFERFRQGTNTLSGLQEGLGLGLAISKSYIEMLGGTINIESTPKVGTKIHFAIPYKPFNNMIKPNNDKVSTISLPQGHTILVVDDVEVNFLLVEEILAEQNLTILYAHNGEEAVEITKENPDISLVLMDIRMPIMDGYTATKLIKEFNPNIKIIAQTAYALVGDKNKSLEAGCDDHIGKPYVQEDLLNILKKYL